MKYIKSADLQNALNISTGVKDWIRYRLADGYIILAAKGKNYDN